MNANQEDIAAVLYAIVSRLPVEQLDNITSAMLKWSEAAMNLGNRAQLEAQLEVEEACKAAAKWIMPHDQQLILNVVADVWNSWND